LALTLRANRRGRGEGFVDLDLRTVVLLMGDFFKVASCFDNDREGSEYNMAGGRVVVKGRGRVLLLLDFPALTERFFRVCDGW